MVDKKKIINDIVLGISNRVRESYFINNFIEVYNDIELFCKNISDLPFKQKIWHWINDINTYYLCKCGGRVTFNKNWLDGYRVGCSAKCVQKNSLTKEKRKSTNLEKYGVDNVAKNNAIKNKTTNTNIQRYGFKSSFQNKEVQNKYSNTIQSKYGVNHYFKTEEFEEKRKITNLEKHGVEYFVNTEKTKKTNLEKYGKEWYTQTDEYIESVKKTNLEKYGKEWYTQTEEYKLIFKSKLAETILKSKQTNLERYGKWYTQTDIHKNRMKLFILTQNYIDKAKETNLERYGKEWYTQTDEYKRKSINTCLLKYDSEYFFSSKFFMDNYHEKSLINSKLKLFELSKNYFNNLGFGLLNSDGDFITLQDNNKCKHVFVTSRDLFYHRNKANIIECLICNPLNDRSGVQNELISWLKTLGKKVDECDRLICKPYEIDAYIESDNLGLEFNGLYWHSENYKDKNYHLNKTMLCEKNNVNLIHIWEDDWFYRKDVIKSIILNRLNLINDKIYARKCIIKIVNTNRKDIFLENNHIQGTCNSHINIGLYFDEELVSLMSFGYRFINGKKEYELIRFCNKINTSVIGAASKLFGYFVENNCDVDTISSYADISMFSGELYIKLGFKYSHRSSINYWWVVNGIRKHRFNYNKAKLIKAGYDPLKTETEIMHELGNYRIYGCGQDKYIWSK